MYFINIQYVVLLSIETIVLLQNPVPQFITFESEYMVYYYATSAFDLN